MIHISFSREKEMELCDDILNIIASYLNVYDRLPLLSTCKKYSQKRHHVVERIKNIYRVKSDILYQRMRNKTHICTLLPEPIYMREYIETTSDTEQSNDIIELYKDNTLLRKCKFDYCTNPLNKYSVDKLILLYHLGVYINNYCWCIEHREIFVSRYIDIFPEYTTTRVNDLISISKNYELLKKLRYHISIPLYDNNIFLNLIKHNLFYDQEYQDKMKEIWDDQWESELINFREYTKRINEQNDNTINQSYE